MHAQAPYASKKGLVLPASPSGDGYAVTFRIAMRPGEGGDRERN